jgi:transposase
MVPTRTLGRCDDLPRAITLISPQAGPRVAAILSVIESCRRLAIPVRNYLADILPGLADTSVKNVTGLTPKTWAAKTHS